MGIPYVPSVCPECGSNDLEWFSNTVNLGGAVDGRICMREVSFIFYLGCNCCSETIKIVNNEDATEFLNKVYWKSFILDEKE